MANLIGRNSRTIILCIIYSGNAVAVWVTVFKELTHNTIKISFGPTATTKPFLITTVI